MNDPAGSELGPGTTVSGYRVEALICRGGMGAVYRASDEGLGRKVALKVIAPELASDQRFRERFLRESRMAASLDHPHVVPIYQSGEDGGRLFIAMRYVEGTDLAKLLAAEGALEPGRALALLSQVAEALDAAHAKGLVHRDVKPSNVLIAGAAGSEHCYLADFGLTRRTGSASGISAAGEIVGTLEYIAPEQITGDAPDARSDVYSLGCVLYECLTGQAPFPRATDVALLWAHVHEEPTGPSAIRPELSQELDSAVTRALAKNPEERYRSAGALIEACSVSGSTAAPVEPAMPPTNLPRPLSSFVGRDAELAEVRARLEAGARLLALTGPGGSGKTRLALEVASSLVSSYEDGVFWVGLAMLRDPTLVTVTIAQTLEAKGDLAAHIGDQKVLILLDNLEQVIEAAPDLSRLLGRCPNLSLLVTSRELLRVQGEVEYPVPPLAEPEAISLFCERSSLEPSKEIAELCARLDNLPLAVELAAAHTKLLDPGQLLARLEQRLPLLGVGPRDAPERQRTLKAAIEWSYDLLDDEAKPLFTRLAVFAGSFSLEAAEEVGEANLDVLLRLVDSSLLRAVGDGRLLILETIREYGLERLEEAGEAPQARDRHAEYFAGLADSRWVELVRGDSPDWNSSTIQLEFRNLHGAIEWSLERGRTEDVLAIGSGIFPWWSSFGYTHQGRLWLEQALERPSHSPPRRGHALAAFGDLALSEGDLDDAKRAYEESLAIFRDLDEPLGIAVNLAQLADIALLQGDHEIARRFAEESAAIRRERLGSLYLGRALNSLAHIAVAEADYDQARELLEEAIQLWSVQTPESTQLMFCHESLGEVLRLQGDFGNALEAFARSLRLCQRRGEPPFPDALEGIAAVWATLGERERAARTAGAAQRIREQLGTAFPAHPNRPHPERVEPAWSEGHAMNAEEALEYALSSLADV